MRILMVSDFLPPVRGGLEGHVDDLAGGLAERGHDVHVVSLTPDPQLSSPLVTAHVVAAASTRLLPHQDASRPFPPPVVDPLARRQLARLLRDVQPDVVHGHSWLARSVPRSSDVPLVLTAHDYAPVCPLHTLQPPSGKPCAGPSVRTCSPCAAPAFGGLTSALLAAGTAHARRSWRPDAVVSLSAQVARSLSPHMRVPVEVLGGLLSQPAPPQSPAELPTTPYVLFAGDPSAHKGIDTLLAVWAGTPRPPATLLIAATRDVDRDLPDDVLVVRLDRSQMPEAWRRAAVAVVPSVWAEPFGMAAMEALAVGTPVVASAVGALPEIVRDGVDGLLVPPGDPEALRVALTVLLDDSELQARMSEGAVRGAERFSRAVVLPRFEALYGRLLAGRVEAGR